jgi:hypothetical protein
MGKGKRECRMDWTRRKRDEKALIGDEREMKKDSVFG